MRLLSTPTRLLGVALLGLLLAGCTGGNSTNPSPAAAGGKRIVVLTNGNSPFWDAARVGVQEAEKDLKLKDARLAAVVEVNDGTDAGQLNMLRQFASQSDIVGVGVSVNTAGNQAIAQQMRDLQAKGVFVVAIDSDVDRDKHRDARFAFIGTDNLVGGRELGKCAKGLRPDGGEYVTFVGITGAQNAIERVGGFAQGAGDKFKALDNMGDNNDRTRARENVRNALINHKGLNVLVGIWSYNAPAIVDVVREKGVRPNVTVVAFDAEPKAIEEMGNGMIDAMVVQNPFEMGYQGVRLLKALHEKDDATIKKMLPNHGQKDGDVYDTGLKVVVPGEGSPLKKEFFEKNTQFLKLSEFRDWLKKFNLEGS
jgi:ribose transport system substrate-binding protein